MGTDPDCYQMGDGEVVFVRWLGGFGGATDFVATRGFLDGPRGIGRCDPHPRRTDAGRLTSTFGRVQGHPATRELARKQRPQLLDDEVDRPGPRVGTVYRQVPAHSPAVAYRLLESVEAPSDDLRQILRHPRSTALMGAGEVATTRSIVW